MQFQLLNRFYSQSLQGGTDKDQSSIEEYKGAEGGVRELSVSLSKAIPLPSPSPLHCSAQRQTFILQIMLVFAH